MQSAAKKSRSRRRKNITTGARTQATESTKATISSVRSGKAEKLKRFVTPMLAQLHDQPFDNDEWVFETKWDGYRAIAETGDKVRLYSRNGLSFTGLYPAVADELRKIKDEAIFDGEVVVLNESNKPDFQQLQRHNMHDLPIRYYIFDCLSYRGVSIMHLPLIERKAIARKCLPKSKIIRYSDHVKGKGIAFFAKVKAQDLEGIIAKKADSIYVPGMRSRDWLKIKNHNTQEAIIAGYTAPRRTRKYFGALILAMMVRGRLKYIGHTGTGFTQEVLRDVYEKMQPLKIDASPFAGKVPVNAKVTWIKPALVCNVKFTEVTKDGILRHAVFMGLRVDKSPKEVNTLDRKAP